MLIYSPDGGKIEGLDGDYRNPDFFDVVSPATKVVLVGDYPHIEQAYKDANILVEQYEFAENEPPKKPEKEQTKAK